jgi:6-phosphogluconate dehydrogenase
MVGLGIMGRNLVLNTASHGCAVAGHDKDRAKVEALRQESEERDARGAESIQESARLLR